MQKKLTPKDRKQMKSSAPTDRDSIVIVKYTYKKNTGEIIKGKATASNYLMMLLGNKESLNGRFVIVRTDRGQIRALVTRTRPIKESEDIPTDLARVTNGSIKQKVGVGK